MKRIVLVLIFLLSFSICYPSDEKITSFNANFAKIEPIDNNSKIGFSDNMLKSYRILPQYIAPQHTLSHFAGWLAECRWPWLKNHLIKRFLRNYAVNMHEAVIEDPFAYPNFNSFFLRRLKPELRPIAQNIYEIASPVDGYVSQIGKIDKDTLIQAKGFYFNLKSLLGGSEKNAQLFSDGLFATLYLSPKDYHRVHMPYAGTLRETIYIPGKLFSVSQKTSQAVPNLFVRNERLVCIFDTDMGPMAVILVGAMLVGHIDVVWSANTSSARLMSEKYGNSIHLSKGAELGQFKLGSTVIVLFAKDKAAWSKDLHEDSVVRMGQLLGTNEKG